MASLEPLLTTHGLSIAQLLERSDKERKEAQLAIGLDANSCPFVAALKQIKKATDAEAKEASKEAQPLPRWLLECRRPFGKLTEFITGDSSWDTYSLAKIIQVHLREARPRP
jgi:hypothetical protein